jgi:hypothetical protein
MDINYFPYSGQYELPQIAGACRPGDSVIPIDEKPTPLGGGHHGAGR